MFFTSRTAPDEALPTTVHDEMDALARSGLPRLSSPPWRRMLVNAAGLLAFIELFGLPAVQVSYQYHGSPQHRVVTEGDYLTVTGRQYVRAGEYGEGCPILVLMKLRPSPLERIGTALSHFSNANNNTNSGGPSWNTMNR